MCIDVEKKIVVSGKRYDMVYIVNDFGKRLDSYEPHKGYYLYDVAATYAKGLRPSHYYVIARTVTEARQIFKRYHGDILSYIHNVDRCSDTVQNTLLHNYLEHPTIII